MNKYGVILILMALAASFAALADDDDAELRENP